MRQPTDDAPATATVALGIDVAAAERLVEERLAAPLRGRQHETRRSERP